MGNRIIQHGVAYEKMPLSDLSQRLAVPRIAQDRQRGAIILHGLSEAAPIDVLHLLNNMRRDINDHYFPAFSISAFFSRRSIQRFCTRAKSFASFLRTS